ncbi:expressed unknown protein [Seminavis robusta]|uniref:Uncharacterized protein n=1 Tax=Seminavis robusta TaxID=568900 RepID=A0A9N8HEI3_9STRA|nr:expressed unknown protein [Seminavis robusta]|eukprot:Sro475_g150320.1 n/a (233) ;mRNA; r:3215-3913
MMLGNDFSSSAGHDDPQQQQQQQESQRNVYPVPTNSQMFRSITSRVNDDNDDDDDDSYQVPLGWSTNGPVVDDEHLATAAPQGQHDDDKERYHDQHDIESGRRQRTDTPSQLNKQSPGENGPVGHTQQLDKKERTPKQNAPVDAQLNKASPVENPKNQDGCEKQQQPTTSKDNNTPFINPPNPAIRENELDISDLSLPQHSQSSYLDISGLTHKSPPSSHLDVSQLSFESFP